MPIYNRVCESDFTVIPNSLATNVDLSPSVRGVLVHFLSMPKDWNPSDENLKELKVVGSIRKLVRTLRNVTTNGVAIEPHCGM